MPPLRIAALAALLLAAYAGSASLGPTVATAQESGGIFGAIFGSWGMSSQPRSRYGTSRSASPYSYGSPYGQSYDYSNWYGGDRSYQSSYGRYRTLCVRTCDGYYFPISFSTTRAGIARDAKACQARCSGGKLFYHRNPGADVQHMVDLAGQRYAGLDNAFRYRTELVKGCQCKPQPWSEAAKEEYERRAEAEANGEPPTAIAQTPQDADIAPPQTEVAGWTSSDQAERPTRRSTRRTRYRANDPALEGRWWADRF